MKLIKIIFIVFSFIYLSSCADYQSSNISKKKEKTYYSSSGFALIYNDNLYEQKIVNKKINKKNLAVMHRNLKKNTLIRISNPDNMLSVDTKIYKKSDYPKIFNVVISDDISKILKLDQNNPFVEIIELKKNKTFIAKESNTFEEEKNVAQNVPVNEVKMDDLSKDKDESKNENKLNQKGKFILVISDFYYEETAVNLLNNLMKKIQTDKIFIRKMNDKKYRLFAGPFKDFNALKTTYISLNKLGFEDLNIYRE
tara:strand:+ start:1024 stop:1785 length:762 start_codon:yes stop_codon:yes gene_type:complete